MVTREFGEAPRIAAVRVDSALLDRVGEVAVTCANLGIATAVIDGPEIAVSFGLPDIVPPTAESAFDREHELRAARCEVRGDGTVVWRRADGFDDDLQYETEPVAVAVLLSGFERDGGIPAFRHGRFDPSLVDEVRREVAEAIADREADAEWSP